jgi:Peptidase C13 family
VLVVSACYSGGFIEPLKDDHTLIITASSATKTSFGCGNESEATYLARALYDEALRKTHSIEAAFNTARDSIREREKAQGFEPSDPQIFVGAAIREKLMQLQAQLAQPAR